ncbi:hypothetical protein LCGC14_0993340 [marine sediment metagenome]|uniref:Uncharacterized protein n=1 Tax=marine sediment metagenome TaxID=412755 RepID=A0A0F9N543_9ZZZZ
MRNIDHIIKLLELPVVERFEAEFLAELEEYARAVAVIPEDSIPWDIPRRPASYLEALM